MPFVFIFALKKAQIYISDGSHGNQPTRLTPHSDDTSQHLNLNHMNKMLVKHHPRPSAVTSYNARLTDNGGGYTLWDRKQDNLRLFLSNAFNQTDNFMARNLSFTSGVANNNINNSIEAPNGTHNGNQFVAASNPCYNYDSLQSDQTGKKVSRPDRQQQQQQQQRRSTQISSSLAGMGIGNISRRI